MGVVVGWNDAKERTAREVREMARTVRERLRRPPPPDPNATPAREIYTEIELRNQRTCERTEPETTVANDWLNNGDAVVCTTTRWDDLSGEILSREVEHIEPSSPPPKQTGDARPSSDLEPKSTSWRADSPSFTTGAEHM